MNDPILDHAKEYYRLRALQEDLLYDDEISVDDWHSMIETNLQNLAPGEPVAADLRPAERGGWRGLRGAQDGPRVRLGVLRRRAVDHPVHARR